MALDFPASPTNGQVYGSYVYNSTVGAWQSKEDPATVATVSTTAPASANPGDLWYDSDDGTSYMYYDDGTSAQWVELLSSGLPLLNTKADLTYVDSQDATLNTAIQNNSSGISQLFSIKANLAGATFTGDVNIGTSGTYFRADNGVGYIQSSQPAKTVLSVIGAASQTANLQEWQNSSGTPISYIDSAGQLFAQDLSLTKNTAHIELGGVSGTANTPYIDFHSSAAFSDYNARIIADGGTASNASGNLTVQAAQLNLPTKTYMPGAVVQVSEVRAAARDKSASSSAVDIISTTFTTKLASSKLLLMWHSGQVSMSGPQVNMMIYFTIDGTDISDFTTNHYFYGDNNTANFRHVVTIPIMTGALSMGAHTIKVRGQAYNGTATYDFQSTSSPERRSRLVIMEVAQ